MTEHSGKAFIAHLLRRVEAMEVITPEYKAIKSIASYVSDLERRLEKAVAERDAAHNEALEKAAERLLAEKERANGSGDFIVSQCTQIIRSLKTKETPNADADR